MKPLAQEPSREHWRLFPRQPYLDSPAMATEGLNCSSHASPKFSFFKPDISFHSISVNRGICFFIQVLAHKERSNRVLKQSYS